MVLGDEIVQPVAHEAQEVPRPPLEEGVFPLARVQKRAEPEPARFTAELPQTVEAFRREWSDYPVVHVTRRLCAGDPPTIARYERAVAAATQHGAEAEQLRQTYGMLLTDCDGPSICKWATATIDGGRPAAVVAWEALANCGPGVAPFFERDDAPAATVLRYFDNRRFLEEGYVPRFSPGLARALRAVALAGERGETRLAALAFARIEDARVTTTLLRLHDELPAGEVRDQVAVALGQRADPKARAIFTDYCARPGQTDSLCKPDEDPLDLSKIVVDAPAQPTPSATPPAPSNLAERLRTAGLLWRGPLEPSAEPPAADATVDDILASSGPTHCFDLETDQYPNQHDGLLADLAELAGPPLAAALFVEEAPPMELEEGRWLVGGREVPRLPPGVRAGAPYRLRAYLNGQGYEVAAQDLGDWYDLDQVLGLLNAIAKDQGSETRLVALASEDQVACVVVAPRQVLLTAARQRLIRVGPATAAVEQSKQFEDQVRRQLVEEAKREDGKED